MGLASKLQAAQAGGGGMGMPGGAAPPGGMGMPGGGFVTHGAPASAPPAPQFAAGGAPPPGAGFLGAPPGPAGPGPYPGSAPPGAPPAGYPSGPTLPGAPGAAPYAQPGAAPYPQPGAPGAAPHPQAGAPAPQLPPQQQAGGMPGGAGAGGAPGGMQAAILGKLNAIVAANQLQRFYQPQALQQLAARIDATVDFRALAARWRLPVEMAVDLSALALYDTVLYCDDSGSMAFEENGERIDDLRLIATKISEIATLFDQDGLTIRFMNSAAQGNGVRSAQDVMSLLAGVQYQGLTPLATGLTSKVLQPIVYHLAGAGQLAKPVLVIAITDGEPTDTPRDLVAQVIKDCRARLAAFGPKAVAFAFAQVGKDARAQAFLAQLDTHPDVGGSIDCTSYFEMEQAEFAKKGVQLSPEMWLYKMMLGAIDPSVDEGDE